MVGKEDHPFGEGQTAHAFSEVADFIDIALPMRFTIDIRAGINGIREYLMDRRYVGVIQRMSARMWEREGNFRPSDRNQSQTCRADPVSVKRWKTVRMAPVTASSGSKRTSPSSSPHTNPTGRPRRSSPRAALFLIPPSSRARRIWSSASDMVPLSPRTSRSLKCPGWWSPSPSPINVSVMPQRSRSRYQSALLRASLDTSSAKITPTRPSATSAAIRSKPDRFHCSGAGLSEIVVDHRNLTV